jgi:hypothetical protein
MSPTVQVVTAGTDWAAIVAAGVTGLSAIAGIVGTAWQAGRARQAASEDLKITIEASAMNLRASSAIEERRMLQREKMRSYSEYQGAVDTLIGVGSQSFQQGGEFSEARSALLKANAEVVLMSPTAIGALTDEVTKSVMSVFGDSHFAQNFDQDGIIKYMRKELYELMKADIDTKQD